MTEQNTDPAAADPSGPGNGPQNVTEAPEDATVGDDTGAAWSDAFRPDNDGGFTPDQYQAAIEEMGLQDDEPEDTDAEQADDEPDADGELSSRREAKYRIRAREAESRLQAAADENSRLLDQLDAVRRVEAERLAADRLADPPGDLWRAANVEDVLADDGSVDPVKVDKLCTGLVEQHPHWGVARPVVNANSLRSGASKPDEAPVTNWRQAFAPPPSE